ncbi:chemotaxis protein CheX [Lysinibacillus piscis]|nr:chemotaxis protein CheX [Lysinibacillus sp. KH24]
MSSSKHFQTILNGTIHALKTILPVEIEVQAPSIVAEPFQQQQMGVLIGLIGDLKGRVIIDSSPEVFSGIGSVMFGMPLEGAMLESFTGELGNMIAGNLCTAVGQENLEIDITPPTVMVGNTKLYGFERAFSLPVSIPTIGPMTVLLTIEEDEE